MHFQDPYLLRLLNIRIRIEDIHSLWIRYNQEAYHSQVKRMHCLEVLCFLEIGKDFIKKKPYVKDPVQFISSLGVGKNVTGLVNFPQGFPFLSGR